MKRPHPFRFKRARRKDGAVYQVVYDVNPSQVITSPIHVDEQDTRSSGPGYEQAVAWAYANMDAPLKPRATLKDLTVKMFTDECSWRQRVVAKGREFAPGYFSQHRSRLETYILPALGKYPPSEIRPSAVDGWLLALKLSKETKNKIISTLRLVFDELVYLEVITPAENVARKVSYFTERDKKREPITVEDFHKLFPEDLDEMVRIWGSLRWAAFFYIMATTGMRPGEVAAMDLRFWVRGVGYAVAQSVENSTGRIKGLKTEKKGVHVKPAYFTKRAEDLLTLLIYKGAPSEGLLFPNTDGGPMKSETSNKHFKASCARAGVNLAGQPQYILRHFYSTQMATVLDEDQVAKYLGQTTYRDEYDHRKIIEYVKGDKLMQEAANKVFAPPES